MYTRAAPSDYDDWATVYGNKGWSAAERLPLLQKVHTSRVFSLGALVEVIGRHTLMIRRLLDSAKRTRYDLVKQRTDTLDP